MYKKFNTGGSLILSSSLLGSSFLNVTDHKMMLAFAGAWSKAWVEPLTSDYGAEMRNELVLKMYSAGDLFDSLRRLSGSLANIAGSVDNTFD